MNFSKTIDRRIVNLVKIMRPGSIHDSFRLFVDRYPIITDKDYAHFYEGLAGLKIFRHLEKLLGNKRKIHQFITIVEELNGFTYGERGLLCKNYRDLIEFLSWSELVTLFQMIKSRDINFHDFISSLPAIRQDLYTSEELFEFFKRIIVYKPDIFFRVLPFSNYGKIRASKNQKDMLAHITVVELARGGCNSSSVVDFRGSLTKLKMDSDRICEFSKKFEVISQIGADTHCCFRKGGYAGGLVNAAIRSPIAGILHGYNNTRWFSFVWDIIEPCVDEDKFVAFEKNLILDNIEASGSLNNDSYKKVLERLRSLKTYNKVYCGTMRNDCDFVEDGIQELTLPKRQKPYSLTAFQKHFKSMDDSKVLVILSDDSYKHESVVRVRRMNRADLHRCDYIQRMVYGDLDYGKQVKFVSSNPPGQTFEATNDPGSLEGDSNFPDSFKLADKLNLPRLCYIVENDTHIFGYLMVTLKFYSLDNDLMRLESEISNTKELKKITDSILNGEKTVHDYNAALCIEDVVCLPYSDARKCMLFAFNDLANYLKNGPFSTITLNANENSKPLVKRLSSLSDDIRVVEQSFPFTAVKLGRFSGLKTTGYENRISELELNEEEDDTGR